VAISANNSPTEAARLEALLAYGIIDTPPEQAFDDLVELAAAVCNTPVAAIAFVDGQRSWLKAKRGVDVAEFPRDLALTAEAMGHADVFVVTDTLAEAQYRSTPIVSMGFRFFAGMPLVSPEGHALGTVCVLDKRPRVLSAMQMDGLRAIARHVMSLLELRRVSQAESAARQRFRSLVEQLPGGVYIEGLGASSGFYFSPHIEQLTGYSPEEWTSEADFFSRVIHPEDRERVLTAFARAHETHVPIQIEYRVIAKDGRVVWIQDDAAIARDDEGQPLYFQGFMADVTVRKQNELKLREIQDRYQELAEQLPFVTYVDDPAGSAGYISPQVEQLLGCTPEEWLAADDGVSSFAHPDDRNKAAEDVRRARRQSRAYELEYRMIATDGREIWVQNTAVPIRDEAGKIRYWQGYIVDITERRAIAEERDRLLERERAQNERLRSLDRMKDEFVALVSHELRTPLTSIRGYLELVLDDADQLQSEHRGFLEIVDRNADRLLHLVSDLLLIAQADAGRLTFDWTAVELEPLVAQCVQAARPAAEVAGVELVFESESLRPIVADPARIGQLLDNLISNAIKFTPAGGRVDVLVSGSEDSAVVEVRDTGFGISAEDQEQLFERFFRTRSASEKAIPGTGLGLSIAKAIVDAHDGSISVESAEQRGTTFRVELPAERVPPTSGDDPELDPSGAITTGAR
jgi:PAS domain S-box-containing protein